MSEFSQEDIEYWLKELFGKCRHSEWQEVYKAGYRDALTAVMGKMDDDRKARARAA